MSLVESREMYLLAAGQYTDPKYTAHTHDMLYSCTHVDMCDPSFLSEAWMYPWAAKPLPAARRHIIPIATKAHPH